MLGFSLRGDIQWIVRSCFVRVSREGADAEEVMLEQFAV